MPILKGNLHAHTTLSDGLLGPLAVLERYRARGYDFLAFTDHRCFLGPGPEAERAYWNRLPSSHDGFIVFHGIEEEPPEIERRHLGVIHSPNEELRIVNHPNEYGLSVEQVIESVRIAGAHALEITCHGRYLEPYDIEPIAVPRIATDDAHNEQEIGVSWIEVEAERDPDAILRAIKAGAFERVIAGRQVPWRPAVVRCP